MNNKELIERELNRWYYDWVKDTLIDTPELMFDRENAFAKLQQRIEKLLL